MNVPQCDHLDEYLAGGLSDHEAAVFEAHLADCAGCRGELERQKQIERLLVQAVRQLEPVPVSLIERVERQARPSRRRRAARLAWSLSAAAALAAVIFGIWFAVGEPEGQGERPPMVQNHAGPVVDPQPLAPRPPQAAPVRVDVRVTVADPSQAILVSKQTEAPNVSIVMIYPTVKPARATNGPVAD